MSDDEDARTRMALDSCDRVRAVRIRFLQVRPDPKLTGNVYFRIGAGPWTFMHAVDAVAFLQHYKKNWRKISQRKAEKKRQHKVKSRIQRAEERAAYRKAMADQREKQKSDWIDAEVDRLLAMANRH